MQPYKIGSVGVTINFNVGEFVIPDDATILVRILDPSGELSEYSATRYDDHSANLVTDGTEFPIPGNIKLELIVSYDDAVLHSQTAILAVEGLTV